MEIRGVWMTTTDSQVFRSKEKIHEAVAFLAETGFNVVFPVVWTKGFTLYPSRVLRETFGMEIDPLYQGRDPLAELIEAAKSSGIAVIPWFEYGFASSYQSNGGMLLQQKPEWAAKDLSGNLLNKNGFEWMNALHPEVQNFLFQLILEVVQNYPVAGIQGDDRLPAFPREGGYDEFTRNLYRQSFQCDPPSNCQDSQWLQWRADLLTEFLSNLSQHIKAINPNLLVSLSPNIYPWCLNEYLQDSQSWLKRGLMDLMHPQIYRRDFQSYQRVVNQMVKSPCFLEQLPRISPGILIKLGKYRISPEYLLSAIDYNRACGLPGEVLFFYEGLREDDNALAKPLRSRYSSQVPFPTALELNQWVASQPTATANHRGSGWLDWLKSRF